MALALISLVIRAAALGIQITAASDSTKLHLVIALLWFSILVELFVR